MEKKTKQIERIEKALAQAHREQTAPDLPPEWREGVMRHIRRIRVEAHEEGASPSTTLVFQRMILPFATATGLVAVALLAYLLTTSPGDGTRSLCHAHTRSIRVARDRGTGIER